VTLVVMVAGRLRPPPQRVAVICTPASFITRSHLSRVRPGFTAFVALAARSQRRSRRAVMRQFPDVVDVLVLTIRAGYTPLQAIETLASTVASPFDVAFQGVLQQVARGARFADAIGELTGQLGVHAQALADALALCDRYGTPLAPMLDRLADEARAQRRRHAEAAARQLPVRLTFPLVGCTLPSFVLLTVVPLMAGTLSSLQGLRR
jgi:Flp pilus assembly protein TadB